MKKILISLAFFTLLSCGKDKGLNIFSVNDDIKFGEQLDAQIKSDQMEYPILDKTTHPEAYAFIEGIMNNVLQSEHIQFLEEFDWKVTIIDKDIQNAFAAPGGKLYFYTGLLKYLNSSAELAGVMAHEVAHSDRRHSSEQMTKAYGLNQLTSIVLGEDASQLEQIIADMAIGATALKFSRKHEYEADEYSVRYLESISDLKNYHCTAITDFFDRLVNDGLVDPDKTSFEFMRTHPYEANRVTSIEEVWVELGSPVGEKFETDYVNFLSNL